MKDGLFRFYLQGGGGLAWAQTRFFNPLEASAVTYDEIFWSFHLTVAAGVQIMLSRFFGFYAQTHYTWAPVIKNMFEERHNSGGLAFSFGIRGAF